MSAGKAAWFPAGRPESFLAVRPKGATGASGGIVHIQWNEKDRAEECRGRHHPGDLLTNRDQPAFLSRFRREARQKAADTRRVTERAQAYSNSMSSTLSKRNEVDAA